MDNMDYVEYVEYLGVRGIGWSAAERRGMPWSAMECIGVPWRMRSTAEHPEFMEYHGVREVPRSGIE